MSVELEKQINKLGRIKMDNDFKASLRAELMEKTAMNKPVRAGGFWAFDMFHVNLLKHAYAPIALIVFMFLGSGVLAMRAAGDSLPGEFLYGVKRAGERAQITLTMGQASKVNKEMDFAGNRIDELSRLADLEKRNDPPARLDSARLAGEARKGEKRDDLPTPCEATAGELEDMDFDSEFSQTADKVKISDDPDSSSLMTDDSQVIAKAVDDFHKELAKVNNRLDFLNEKPDVEAVEVARAIEEKTGEFVETLNQVTLQEKLSPMVREKIAKAFDILDEVNTRALGVAVRDSMNVDSSEMESLMGRLDDKILATEAQVTGVSDVMEGDGVVGDSQGVLLSLEKKIELAKIILMEARESLVAKDLEMTLQKVEESKELANEVSDGLESGTAGRLEAQESLESLESLESQESSDGLLDTQETDEMLESLGSQETDEVSDSEVEADNSDEESEEIE